MRLYASKFKLPTKLSLVPSQKVLSFSFEEDGRVELHKNIKQSSKTIHSGNPATLFESLHHTMHLAELHNGSLAAHAMAEILF